MSGVLVSCSYENAEGQCSGIAFSNGWVITSGTLLGPIIQADSKYKKTLDSLNNSLSSNKLMLLTTMNIRFSILLQKTSFDDKQAVSSKSRGSSMKKVINSSFPSVSEGFKDRVTSFDQLSRSLSNNRRSPPLKHFTSTSAETEEREICSVWMWRCPLVMEAINHMLGGWTLGTTSSEGDEEDSELVRHLMPIFLILSVKSVKSKDAKKALHELYNSLVLPVRGQQLLVEGTPFNNRLFYNSVSHGIASNIFGPEGCMLLTDVRTTYGCEGAPIFRLESGDNPKRLTGMVACPLTWWKGEWIGFSLGLLLQPILYHLLKENLQRPIPTSAKDIPGLDDSVVLVRCGDSWGSGVCVDSSTGLILTCSHVVCNADSSFVTVYWKGSSLPAHLVYRTKDNTAFDVGVLEVGKHFGLNHLKFASSPPVKGEPTVAAGFPIFSERNIPDVLPTVTLGIVSHVTGGSSLVQTTCCIQSGMSGGAVMRLNGELLALVACNTQDVNSGALYPHVNMAVPASVLTSPLNKYITTRDVKALHALESKDPYVQQVWKLNPGKSKL